MGLGGTEMDEGRVQRAYFEWERKPMFFKREKFLGKLKKY
jgi:hypothetical protein